MRVLWDYPGILDADFKDRVEKQIAHFWKHGAPRKSGSPNFMDQIDYVVLIDCQNVPTIALRKLLAVPGFAETFFGKIADANGATGLDGDTLLNARTRLIFYDDFPSSGLPADYKYPENASAVNKYQMGYDRSQYFIRCIKSYFGGGYVRIPKKLETAGKDVRLNEMQSFCEGIYKALSASIIRKRYYDVAGSEPEYRGDPIRHRMRKAKTLLQIFEEIRDDADSIFKIAQNLIGKEILAGQTPEMAEMADIGSSGPAGLRWYLNESAQRPEHNHWLADIDDTSSPPIETFLRMLSICEKFAKRSFSANLNRISQVKWFSDALECYRDAELKMLLPNGPPELDALLGPLDGTRARLSRITRNLSSTANGQTKEQEERGNVANRAAAKLTEAIRAMEVFRDAARWHSRGVMPWLRDLAQQDKPLKLLMIDETLPADHEIDYANRRDPVTYNILKQILEAMKGATSSLSVHVISRPAGLRPESNSFSTGRGEKNTAITYSLSDRDDFLAGLIRSREQLFPESGRPPRISDDVTECAKAWLDYDVIAVEIDYAKHMVGPRVIQWLSSFIDREVEREAAAMSRSARRRLKLKRLEAGPAIIAFTRDDQLGNVHDSMSMGALSYVSKERLLQFPGRVKRAFEARQNRIERVGQRSNFRILYQMMPDQRAKLTSTAPHDLIKGITPWSNKGRITSGKETFSRTEEQWIRQLPKADLHCHFGTSVPLDTIKILALNTAGYLFSRSDTKEKRHDEEHIGVRNDEPKYLNLLNKYKNFRPDIKLTYEICQIIVSAEEILSEYGISSESRAQKALEDACKNWFQKDYGERFGGIGDSMLKDLHNDAHAIMGYQVAAVFVAALAVWEHLKKGKSANWSSFKSTLFSPITTFMQSPDASTLENHEILNHFRGKLGDALGRIGERKLWAGAPADYHDSEEPSKQDRLSAHHMRMKERSSKAFGIIRGIFEKVKGDEIRGEDDKYKDKEKKFKGRNAVAPSGKISLDSLVRCSLDDIAGNPADRSLSRYLSGCAFLGADHLQYPENLVIAAHSIVRSRAEDGIIYSELRAELTGYAKAGMDAYNATNLLMRAFDFATMVQRPETVDMGAGRKASPFIRVNLIVAAKRHKSEGEAKQAIDLARYFLARPPRKVDPENIRKRLPAWWQPSRVVGFDLSGDESQKEKEDKIVPHVRNLADISAQITIHAGEAKSADSIWKAVYDWSANRIGHGLRLREKETLLKYCISEDICMEMCPISNQFTGHFVPIYDRDDFRGSEIYHYPLRYFLDQGLPVCINTDNRYLHPEHYDTLTAEYMMAARLSGGLTKWELLKLVKGGFRGAFLPKEEIAVFLDAVEDRVFATLE